MDASAAGTPGIDPRRLAALREWLDRRLAEIDLELGREASARHLLAAAALWAELRKERQRIDAAIARMRAGAYGRCCRCGVALSPEQLHADPAAMHCMDCRIETAEDAAEGSG